ncbi:MAG: Nif3-like dinuclear metal center hexameric protein [Clostridia bacterium]|nr:Nif3-like dinuclear metal center hexameric protein [Clostridia bacterium]
MTVKDLYDFIHTIAPFDTKAEWDNPGLLVGDGTATVTRAVVALDVTMAELAQAKRVGAQAVIAHHPVIFHPQKSFLAGDVCYEAARLGIACVCAHTNLDKAPGGVNDALCEALGMTYEKLPDDYAEGFLNVGTIDGIDAAEELANHIAERLNAAVRYADAGVPIGKIGVCSGAGADEFAEAQRAGCTAMVTGDASYHDFLDAKAAGVSLFAAGHFETEIVIVDVLIRKLSAAFPSVEFLPSERENPVKTVV